MRHNPQPQEVYRHFKGNLYQIRCLAKHSETGEMMVVYQAMYGDFQIYVRELSSFMEEVDRKRYLNAPGRYRFELMNAQSERQAAEVTDTELVEMAQHTDIGYGKARGAEAVLHQETTAQPGLPEMTAAGAAAQPELPEPMEAETAAVPDESYGTQEELNIDPMVLQFLDADSYERRLEILSMLHCRIDDDMINIMAVAADIEIKEGDIESRYEELKNCLLTFAKYECSRLR